MELLLLVVAWCYVLPANGQQVGVSLQLKGEIIPNNSLVNLEDLLYRTPSDPLPTNANRLQTLMCVTDRVACCESPELGNWYHPDGTRVVLVDGFIARFQSNRGQNEMNGTEQFYGSVRLWRKYTPNERGLFHCELPDAENVIHTLCVNILLFGHIADHLSVAMSSPDSTTAGDTCSLTCSATLSPRNPSLPDSNIPAPTFEWFFGPNGNASLPSGLTPTETNLSNNTYRSTLHFSPLSQFHTGRYTCQLGVGSLVNSAMVTVNAPTISVQITTNGALVLGQNGYSLTCGVNGAENLNSSITYQWTKNNATQTQIQVGTDPKVLLFSPLRLSDAGQYTCKATVSSHYLNNDITVMNSQDLAPQIPTPASITLKTSEPKFIIGSDITFICTVELNSAIVESDLSLLMMDVQLSRDGTPLTLTDLTVTGTVFTYTTQLNSFGRSDSGNYTCTATVEPRPTSTYFTRSIMVTANISIKAATAPPVDVQATQSSSSGPVEVSWSPPSDETNIITGYRIFYNNGENTSVQSVATSIGLQVNGNYIGQSMSIRSEANQLYSELVNVSVTRSATTSRNVSESMRSSSCLSEVGVAVGAAVFAIILLIVIIVTISVVVLCLCRKKLSSSKDCDMSTNIAYGEVHLKCGVTEDMYYENKPATAESIYVEIPPTSDPPAASQHDGTTCQSYM